MDGIRVAVALGSNLGDRAHHLTGALTALGVLLRDLRASSFIETDPVPVDGNPASVAGQARFLNAAAIGVTSLPARALLDRLLEIERGFGRERPHPGAARTLDLDLILYGDAVIDEPGLIVPHPRFRERLFVLEPLSEIAGEWVDPVTGSTLAELMRALRTSSRAS